MTLISVIIPALNEAGHIESAVKSALETPGHILVEVIVVDGGSTDTTMALAKAAGARVFTSQASRGLQMNHGAENAAGEIYLFLHADTKLPSLWGDAVLSALKRPGVSGGAFTLAIDAPGWGFRLVEHLTLFRARWLGLIYGDQAIFTRSETFKRIGGFKNLPLFEDIDYVMKLKGKGRVQILADKVLSSARRWVTSGIVANTLRNWFLLCLYKLGFNPHNLYRRYYKGRLKG
ncbi:MAG: TIGR04283 family arsenosugar biosynthesis glycosyltransferase [Thermodesulfobacteriota bacterium]